MTQSHKVLGTGLANHFNRLMGSKANIWVTVLVVLLLALFVIALFVVSQVAEYNQSDAAKIKIPTTLRYKKMYQ
jgi:hypothetical protein